MGLSMVACLLLLENGVVATLSILQLFQSKSCKMGFYFADYSTIALTTANQNKVASKTNNYLSVSQRLSSVSGYVKIELPKTLTNCDHPESIVHETTQ